MTSPRPRRVLHVVDRITGGVPVAVRTYVAHSPPDVEHVVASPFVHRPVADASPLAAHPRPVLIREDGLVVDVVQAALRERAQLLLFSQPLCGRCESAQALLDRDHTELSSFIDARIVYAAGHEVDWNGPARSADGPRTPSAIDPAGLLAHTLGIGSERPVAVLIGTDGRPVRPYANGPEELDQLLAVLAASRTPEVVQE
ncbi:hypothetical protein ACFWZW_02160 [Microbacterium enclense]|uniref:hypothetical protein n=1 Tax=Microbacterium enclense TaxID=993073 RepID=UPI0036DC96B5